MKILLPAIIILLFAGTMSGEPSDENIKNVSQQLALIKSDLYSNTIPSFTLIGNTGDAVNRLKNKDLSELYAAFNDLYKSEPAADTLLKKINLFSDRFYLQYGEMIYADLINSQNQKVILFTVSVSCECTLKQCREYEQAMYEFINEYEEKPEFMIIDCFYNEKLPAQYNVTFTPVILIMDKNNNEISRFTREEDIGLKLKNFINERN